VAQQVNAVVARTVKKPVTIETIVVPDPGPGEAVVAVQACGVCHTDLHYREGGINNDFPESSRRSVPASRTWHPVTSSS